MPTPSLESMNSLPTQSLSIASIAAQGGLRISYITLAHRDRN